MRNRLTMGRGVVLTALFVAARVAAADDGAGFLVPGESLETLLAAGERRVVSIVAVEGGELTLSLRTGRTTEPTLRVFRPDGTLVTLDRLRVRRGRADVKSLETDVTGTWHVEISGGAGAGGALALTTRMKLPRTHRFAGVADADAGVHTFAALPGSMADVRVRSRRGAVGQPHVTVLGPGGAQLASAGPAAPAVRIPSVLLAELGSYDAVLREGSGRYSVSVRVAPPQPRLHLRLSDVESQPIVTETGPASVPNAATRAVSVFGHFLATNHVLSLRADGMTLAAAALRNPNLQPATAALDLTHVLPGSYELVLSANGRTRSVGTLEVTNLRPSVAGVQPREIPLVRGSQVLQVQGGGFDADSEVQFVRHSDGQPLPTRVVARELPFRLEVEVHVEPGTGGVYAVRAADASGVETLWDAFEILGPDGRDLLGWPSEVPEAAPELRVEGAAFRPDTNTLLVGAEVGTGSQFVLLDAQHRQPQETFSVAIDDAVVRDPRVVWNAARNRWEATFVVDRAGVSEVHLMRLSADALVPGDGLVLSEETAVGRPDLAADAGTGALLVVWTASDAAGGSRIVVQPVPADGVADAAEQRILDEETEATLSEPRILAASSGRHVIVWGGFTESGAGAVRRVLVDGSGAIAAGPFLDAWSSDWTFAPRPEAALDGTGANVLVAYTPDSPGSSAECALARVDGEARTPLSLRGAGSARPPIRSIGWTSARQEFVVAYTGAGRIGIDRVSAGGVPSLLPATWIEGTGGVLAAGTAALWIALAFDGTYDDEHEAYLPLLVLVSRVH